MMRPDKKIIAVIGATGAQGGGLVRAILNEGEKSEFAVRALVRNTGSQKAEALKKRGVEIVECDVNDEDSITKAIQGCYGMFCVSFFWHTMNPESEKKQALNMANAAKKAGIQHVIWSTLEDTRKLIPVDSPTMPTLMEKYKVPHFDAKGEADHYFMNLELPTTFMVTTFYWDNLISFGMGPKKMPDGTYAIELPMGQRHLHGIASEDIGKCAYGIFKHPEYIGHRIGVAGEALTGVQMAEKLSRALNKEIGYKEISFDEYRHRKSPGSMELGNMFQYYHDCYAELDAIHDIELSRKLNPELMNFDEWLGRHKDHFTI